ncbi:hypothetical protein [Cognatilysobacter segetis]|uniref:hypothetical protein n=1 Tax=Cognatilysobacter segetis TaxID=2492394 RepID=UPI00138FB665|nr:hypothetical protein [Lysobacter segetis]
MPLDDEHDPAAVFSPGHWPVFGHAAPWRPARVHAAPGEAPAADTVDQEFEEYFFE